MTVQEIKHAFKTEFGSISEKFDIIEENLSNLGNSKKEHIYYSGVYVFYLEGEVIKVGRYLTNSRKRALQHIRDNTKNESFEMKTLAENRNAKVLLFNLKNTDDYHWAASVEIYLEKKLNPVIRSKRQG